MAISRRTLIYAGLAAGGGLLVYSANRALDTGGDGDAALQTFATGGFDAVLTDWNMPGKSGLEVIQSIREHDQDVPIFMITTEAEKRRVLEAIHAGVTDYLAKPFESDVLKEKLQKHVVLPA